MPVCLVNPCHRIRNSCGEGLAFGAGTHHANRCNGALGTGRDERADRIAELLRKPAGDTMRG